jgi:hypothetical protein
MAVPGRRCHACGQGERCGGGGADHQVLDDLASDVRRGAGGMLDGQGDKRNDDEDQGNGEASALRAGMRRISSGR